MGIKINKETEKLLITAGGVLLAGWILKKLLENNLYKCPRCNYPVDNSMYQCPNCGQPLKWGGSDQ